MVFPIKRISSPSSSPVHSDPIRSTSSSPSGLDLLLSAAVDSSPSSSHCSKKIASAPQEHTSTSSPVSDIDDSWMKEGTLNIKRDGEPLPFTADGVREAFVHKPSTTDMAASYNSTHKRAKTFPEILMDILSTPDFAPIVSWLPNGNSFAIHNPTDFSAKILPKYFRRVIFRSFIRKLNRWGFRSVKRSVSGFESTFEHKSFCRDEPELTAKMYCKSNPTTKQAKASSSPSPQVGPVLARPNTDNLALVNVGALSRMNGMLHSVSAESAMAMNQQQQRQPQQQQQLPSAPQGFFNDPLPAEQLRNELLLREIQAHRQQNLMSLIHQMPMSEADMVSQYIPSGDRRFFRLRLSSQVVNKHKDS